MSEDVFVITLPCDREAALAALDAIASSIRRRIVSSLIKFFTFMLILLIVPASMGASALLPFATLLLLLLIVTVVLSYYTLEPKLQYLEKLRRDLEEGRVSVEDVCGRPLLQLGRR